jgi:PBP1b-binding outer membrane lipoprotein LpoB
MKKISIIILFAIFFIGCSSNDYKQNSIPMSGIQLAQQNPVILNIRPDPNQNYTHALLAVGYDKDNQTIKNKKFSNIPIDLNNNPGIINSYENSLINESI